MNNNVTEIPTAQNKNIKDFLFCEIPAGWYHPRVFGAHTSVQAIKIMEDNKDFNLWGDPSPIKEILSPDFIRDGK